jgi:hypothetical protein
MTTRPARHGHADAVLQRVKDDRVKDLRAAVLDRSFRDPLDDEARAGFLEWAVAVSQQATHDVLASQRDLDLAGELAGVTQPAIVVHGRDGRGRAQQNKAASSPAPCLTRSSGSWKRAQPRLRGPCRRSRRRPRCPGAKPLNGTPPSASAPVTPDWSDVPAVAPS